LCKAFAQPDDPAKRINDHEVTARWARDQQAAIVGAEIDRGISLPVKRQWLLPWLGAGCFGWGRMGRGGGGHDITART
jgi:hypothetical protein